MNNPHEILGLDSSATREEIKAMYQKLARRYLDESQAPDTALARVAERRLGELNEAYAVLSGTSPGYGFGTSEEPSRPTTSFQPSVVQASSPSPTPPPAAPITRPGFVHAAPAPNGRPALWNPGAASIWAIFTTVGFAAYLHARNAEALGRTDEAKANRGWIGAAVGYYVLTVIISVFLPELPTAPFLGIMIGMWVAWHQSVGKAQIDYVKNDLNGLYEKKSLVGPVFALFGIILGVLFVSAFLLGVVEAIAEAN